MSKSTCSSSPWSEIPTPQGFNDDTQETATDMPLVQVRYINMEESDFDKRQDYIQTSIDKPIIINVVWASADNEHRLFNGQEHSDNSISLSKSILVDVRWSLFDPKSTYLSLPCDEIDSKPVYDRLAEASKENEKLRRENSNLKKLKNLEPNFSEKDERKNVESVILEGEKELRLMVEEARNRIQESAFEEARWADKWTVDTNKLKFQNKLQEDRIQLLQMQSEQQIERILYLESVVKGENSEPASLKALNVETLEGQQLGAILKMKKQTVQAYKNHFAVGDHLKVMGHSQSLVHVKNLRRGGSEVLVEWESFFPATSKNKCYCSTLDGPKHCRCIYEEVERG